MRTAATAAARPLVPAPRNAGTTANDRGRRRVTAPAAPARLSVVFAILWAACAGSGHAEDHLARTKAWMESEAPRILEMTTVTRTGIVRSAVHEFVLDTGNCVAGWSTHNGLRALVPLRDLDPRGVVVRASELFGAPVTLLHLKTAAAAGPTILGWNMGRPGPVESIEMQVRSREDGERLARAFGRAAALCGAASPAF